MSSATSNPAMPHIESDVTPSGDPFLVRWVPGSFGMKTLADCEREARTDKNNMNQFGGKVVAVKQHLDINELWQDC